MFYDMVLEGSVSDKSVVYFLILIDALCTNVLTDNNKVKDIYIYKHCQ